mmetsp:Transcript_40534/g.120950  ORF Transcript_40534/g.120950 Transcript_40534/m.120950 type:complete len:301 (-) Transcript_40534:1163-2065(-)
MKRGRTSPHQSTNASGTPVCRTAELDFKTQLMAQETVEVQPPVVCAHANESNLVCCQCGATQTPQWREGPLGPKTLCNACGVKYYRQAKRTRKGGSGGAARTKARRVVVAAAARRVVAPLAAGPVLSSDSYCTTQMHADAASDASEESIEERDAAMSLLCFAGVDTSSRHVPTIDTPAVGEPVVPVVLATVPTKVEPEAEKVAPTTSVAESEPAGSGVSGSIDTLVMMLGAANPPSLAQLQAAAEAAHKEAAAADAAIAAVTRFLHEKQEEAHCARVRLALVEQILLQRMRQMTAPSMGA